MPLFDAYVFVDWSASKVTGPKRPKKDAVWLGACARGEGVVERYYRTRGACVAAVTGWCRRLVAEGRRVLVGFDFPYGYPRGFAQALALPQTDPPWLAVWRELAARVHDDAQNMNDRFAVADALNRRLTSLYGEAGPYAAGPFWGCPEGLKTVLLKPNKHEGHLKFPFVTQSGVVLPEYRHAEARARGGVQSAWKCFTTGSVGGQALTGIPRALQIRYDGMLAPVSRVWPFETGFTAAPVPATGACVLHAEIWPVLLKAEVQRQVQADSALVIVDQAQVRAMCTWAEREDTAGRLGAYFDRPQGLSDAQVRDCVAQEGWILGFT